MIGFLNITVNLINYYYSYIKRLNHKCYSLYQLIGKNQLDNDYSYFLYSYIE